MVDIPSSSSAYDLELMSNQLELSPNKRTNGLKLIETLRVRLVEARSLPVGSSSSSSSSSSTDRRLCCLIKLDRDELQHSSSVPRTLNPFFGDEFSHEVPCTFHQLHFYLCDSYLGRVPRPFAKLTFDKAEVLRLSGKDTWFPLEPYDRHADISGKIQLELTYDDCGSADGSVQLLRIRVLDYCDLSWPDGSSGVRHPDLYLIVTLQLAGRRFDTKKLRIPRSRRRCSTANKSSSTLDEAAVVAVVRSESPPPIPPRANLKSEVRPSASASQLSSSRRLFSQSNRRNSTSVTPTSSSGTQGEDWPSVAIDLTPVLPTDGESPPSASSRPHQDGQIRVSLWHDLRGGFNSYFHGELCLQLNKEILGQERPHVAWYYLKPRASSTSQESCQSSTNSGGDLGQLRLKMTYQVDHVLPAGCYTPLWQTVAGSLAQIEAKSPALFQFTPAGMVELLPKVDLEAAARPLMKIFLVEEQIRQLIRVLAAQEISRCEDVNTLFRSSSLSSKVIYELMKFVGHQYLLITLKPKIDIIYNERKSCEIDPSRLETGESLEENLANLIRYAEEVFNRVVDSNHRCPQLLKEMFADLRDVTNAHFPGQVEVQRLVLSSFLVMRFFSAAILNPKHWLLKRENASPPVARTLALISKILQKLSNFVVCGHEISSKEPWLVPLLGHFMDDRHKLAMLKFLDRISCVGGENSISGDSVHVLREGYLTQRIVREKRCLSLNWMSTKRRYVLLTETDVYWAKNKPDSPAKAGGKAASSKTNRMALSDLTVIQAVEEEKFNSKHVFQIAAGAATIFLQCADAVELRDWVLAVQRQCRRQRTAVQQCSSATNGSPSQLYDIEIARELEALHMIFLERIETIRRWKLRLEGALSLPAECPALPKALLSSSYCDESVIPKGSGRSFDFDEQQQQQRAASPSSCSSTLATPASPTVASAPPLLPDERIATFRNSLSQILDGTFALEMEHREALIGQLKKIKVGSKENPVGGGDDNYLLLKSRIRDLSSLATTAPAPIDSADSAVVVADKIDCGDASAADSDAAATFLGK